MALTKAQWLALYDALEPQARTVFELFEAANIGEGSYADADTASFDLNERYADLAHAAADILRST